MRIGTGSVVHTTSATALPRPPYTECSSTVTMWPVSAAAAETGRIVTVEEHSVYGGLGSAVAEVVCTTLPVPMRILGVPGVFAPTGSVGWLLEHFNLTPSGIRDAAFELVEARLAA